MGVVVWILIVEDLFMFGCDLCDVLVCDGYVVDVVIDGE